MSYTHTQKGIAVFAGVAIAMVVYLIGMTITIFEDMDFNPALLIPPVMLCVIYWLFKSMTVEIDEKEIRHWFGDSFWKKSYPLNDIKKYSKVEVPWYRGYGIRWNGNGWLYRVAGSEGIELELTSGSIVTIGTTEPLRLFVAISEQLSSEE